MSLKTELEGFCRHPQGYYYVQDASGNYFTPFQFLVALPKEILNSRFRFQTSGGQREYWVQKQGYSGIKEEFVFRTYIPEGRLGWATDFDQTPASQTHYYGQRNKEGQLVSLCGKSKRRDDDNALFILHPIPGKVCKSCWKEVQVSAAKTAATG